MLLGVFYAVITKVAINLLDGFLSTHCAIALRHATLTYAAGSVPTQLKELSVKLTALLEKLENELPPGQNSPR